MKPSEFTRTVKARSAFASIDLARAIQHGYESFHHEDGRRSVWVFPRTGQNYDLLDLYRRSKKLTSALATPHGWFWRLPDENLELAAKFLQRFGPFEPLTFRLNGGDEYTSLDLGDFWNKQRRFHAVTTLWINLENIAALRESWLELHARLEEIDIADEFPLGSIPKRVESGHIELDLTLFQELRSLPPHADHVRSWLQVQDPSALIHEAIELVTSELHGHLRHLAHWRPSADATRPRFELTLIPDNLWSALWYLFALDTQAGVGWRICPTHQRLFYPPRKDRFYCTSKEQCRHSSQKWWNGNKDEQLEKRRAARRRQGATKK
jgi:hypothetical protein